MRKLRAAEYERPGSVAEAVEILAHHGMPLIETVLVEHAHALGPFGAKTVGEPALIPTAAAIGNAIADAIGARVFELPITPERVPAALRASTAAAVATAGQ